MRLFIVKNSGCQQCSYRYKAITWNFSSSFNISSPEATGKLRIAPMPIEEMWLNMECRKHFFAWNQPSSFFITCTNFQRLQFVLISKNDFGCSSSQTEPMKALQIHVHFCFITAARFLQNDVVCFLLRYNLQLIVAHMKDRQTDRQVETEKPAGPLLQLIGIS